MRKDSEEHATECLLCQLLGCYWLFRALYTFTGGPGSLVGIATRY